MRRRLLYPLIFILVCAFGGLAFTVITDSSPELGLDLQGGVSVVLRPTAETSSGELDVALQIIRRRVDGLGVAEPEIVKQGDNILVQLPGVENRDRAIELVGQTAELRFRPVLQEIPTGALEEGDATTTTTAPADGSTTTAIDESTTTTAADGSTDEGAFGTGGGLVEGESAAALQEPDPTTTTAPPTPTTTAPGATTPTTAPPTSIDDVLTKPEDDTAEAQVFLADKDETAIYQLGPMLATGEIVQSADARLGQTGEWEVGLTMHSGAEGIDLFNSIAAKCFQGADQTVCPSGKLAIVLDSVVQSAPSINNANFSRDSISISGAFSEREAKDLALVLKYGSLPVELERQTVKTVSASLGEDSLRAGIIAGLVGIALVVLYLVFYYRALGIVVILGLAVWSSLLYTIVSWLGETRGLALTLAGVTGIIISVGVTVDSYVVFFERLKDEVKAGRTLRSSTERAFSRAFRTILAADISSFLGAAVLWWLTVGSVRGFAFFLGLSTVLDVIVAWSFTRPVVTYLSRSRLFTEAPVLGVARGLAMPETSTTAAAGAGR
ncbi:MAG TPA: protein translocase subunit SecD [Acidimicrobiales bacterium]|nr:protein translocase subunit SecD [Acidimicrobiales bacterium]